MSDGSSHWKLIWRGASTVALQRTILIKWVQRLSQIFVMHECMIQRVFPIGLCIEEAKYGSHRPLRLAGRTRVKR
jgi:hypothetical protein